MITMRFALVLAALMLAGCGNTSLNVGVGTFGGNVGGSVSADIPLGGGDDDESSLPYAQIWLDDAVLDTVFPDKEVPFTANAAEVRALTEYGRSGAEPGITEEQKQLLADCIADRAKCQIQRKN